MEGQSSYKIPTKASEISVLRYYKILVSGDYSHLSDDIDKDKVTEDVASALEFTFNQIDLEFQSIICEKKDFNKLREELKIEKNEFKHNVAIKIISLYEEYGDIYLLKQLNRLGIKINVEKKIEPQLEKISNKLTGLRNKIKIDKLRLYESISVKDKKQEEEFNGDNIETYLDEQALGISMALKLGLNIDVKTTSLMRWANLIKKTRLIKQSYDYEQI